MKRNLMYTLTVEELNMVLLCTAESKEKIIKELQSYLEVSKPDMAEIIYHTIQKVQSFTDEKLTEIINTLKK